MSLELLDKIPENFYKTVERKGYLLHILYGDTDSIFLTIPVKDAESKSVPERWDIAERTSLEINELIVGYNTDILLKRCNIKPEHNKTYFKMEMLIDSAMFLEVKKNYAYKLSCKEGVILDPPKVKYTGIPVIKSDAAKLTQKMLSSMIENVVLDSNITKQERLPAILEIVNNFHKRFGEDCSKYEFSYVGTPGKWAKKDMFINGMKAYNYIMGNEIFSSGSAGKFIYCRFDKSLGPDIDMKKVKGICVPYEYDTEILKGKMLEFGITVDLKEHWSKLYNTSCQRIVELTKKEVKLIKM